MMKIFYIFLIILFICNSSFAKTLDQMSSNTNPDITNDLIYSQDVSDTTEASTGTGKSLTIKNLLKAGKITVDGTNVGINSINPTQQLDVIGTVKATSFIGDGSGLTGISGGSSVSDVVYGSGWNGDTTTAPSKNAVYDKIESIVVGSSGTINTGTGDRVAIYDTAGITIDSSSVLSDNGTNIGIGTVGPRSKLEVNGGVRATSFIGNLTGNADTVTTNANLTGDVTSSGNATTLSSTYKGWSDNGTTITEATTTDAVGIGTTTVTSGALNVVGDELRVGNGGTNTNATASGELYVQNDLEVDGTSYLNVAQVTDDAYAAGWDSSTAVPTKNAIYDKIETLGSASGGWTDAGANIYTTTTTDNVGIGTFAPTHLLHVNGTAYATQFETPPSNSPQTQYSPILSGDTHYIWGMSSDGNGSSNDSLYLSEGTDITATHRMTINAGGNVGIGTDSATQLLQVNGTVKAQAFIGDGASLTNVSSGGWNDGGTNIFTVTTTDRVGIGTTTPNALATLEISKQASTAPLMISSAPGGGGDYLFVSSAGNVGIGTRGPTQVVDVVGTVKATTFSGAGTSLTGTAASLTAGTVTTNANLTGDVTSSGNATTLSSTYTGWSDGGTTIRTTTTTDAVGIGTTTVSDGILQIGGDNVTIGIGGSNGTATGAGELYVKGDLEVDGTITGDGSGITNLGAGGGWTDGGTNVFTTTTTDNVGIGTVSPNSLFAVGTTSQFKVDSSGVITGVGTNISGTASSLTAGNVTTNANLTGNDVTSSGNAATLNSQWKGWTDGGTNIYNTATTDNVGIGTTTPSANLEIVKAGTHPLMVSATGPGDGNYLIVASNGNVGIGTNSPQTLLAVSGTANATTLQQGGVGVVTTARQITVAGTTNEITSSASAQDLSADRTWTLSLPTAAKPWVDGGTNIYLSTTTDTVGIGTTTPASTTTLEIVKQSSNHPLKISSSATGNGNYMIVTSGGLVGIGTTLNSAQTGLAIKNGNVGIGTWDAVHVLDVVNSSSGSGGPYSQNRDPSGYTHYEAENERDDGIVLAVEGSTNTFIEPAGGGALLRTHNDGAHSVPLHIGVNDTTQIYISDPVGGTPNVGIGTTNPQRKFEVLLPDNSTGSRFIINATSANVTTADTFIEFDSSQGSIGTIAGTGVSGTIIYNTFTGSHWSLVSPREGLKVGMLLCANGKVLDKYPHLPQTSICERKADAGAMGVFGGTDKENRDTVLSLGTGFMLVVNKGSDVKLGDFLMSSDERGYAERQPSPWIFNYTVGKAMQGIKWEKDEKFRKIAVIYLGG